MKEHGSQPFIPRAASWANVGWFGGRFLWPTWGKFGRDDLLVNGHGRAGPRVAPDAALALLDGKGPETAQFDTVAIGERPDDFIEDGVDDILDIPLIQVRIAIRDALDEF